MSDTTDHLKFKVFRLDGPTKPCKKCGKDSHVASTGGICLMCTETLNPHTPRKHAKHVELGVKYCGCYTGGDRETMKCPCGATYDKGTVESIAPEFICYDCRRPLR